MHLSKVQDIGQSCSSSLTCYTGELVSPVTPALHLDLFQAVIELSYGTAASHFRSHGCRSRVIRYSRGTSFPLHSDQQFGVAGSLHQTPVCQGLVEHHFKDRIFLHLLVKRLGTARSPFVEVVGRVFPVQLQTTSSLMHVHAFSVTNPSMSS